MPPWLLMALRLLVGGAAGGVGFSAGEQFLRPDDPQFLGPQFPVLPGGGARAPRTFTLERVKRRRRRRALTASDRADIAFIAGLLGPAAGSKFAAIIGAK